MSSNIFLRESLDGFLDGIPFIQPGRKRVDWTLNLEKHVGDRGPTDYLSVIYLPTGFHKAVFRQASWGLLHPGISSRKEQHKYVHAQAEALLEQDVFQRVVYQPSERCLIPLSGFYASWEGVRYRISSRSASGFLVAGLMSPWGRNLEVTHTFGMITTPSNREFSAYGGRMPALLDTGSAWRWLAEKDPVKAVELLKPAPNGVVQAQEESERNERESLVA